MKLFAAFFSFFFLYFLLCVEAKADTFGPSDSSSRYDQADQGYKNTSAAISKLGWANSEVNKWVPWPCIVSQEFQFILSKAYYFGVPRFFHTISAKDFYIRSGLSPPLLFA